MSTGPRRDRQSDVKKMQKPWEIGKPFEDSAPCGAITLVGIAGVLSGGNIRLTVNGRARQNSDLENMIWVVRGDRLEASIAGLAPLTVTII